MKIKRKAEDLSTEEKNKFFIYININIYIYMLSYSNRYSNQK